MKKLINNPDRYVDEVLEGMTLAYPNVYAIGGATGRMLHRATPLQNKVGVVSGGVWAYPSICGLHWRWLP
ncbi:hypothetical protein O1D97_09705 [Marinomonas sp. 15G1-11]|uniref:Uncharacterized protein n=1 Tax=Marinomonas phaeophyticola TaxID=3004091 RepID=A0ABT4JU49_9GAMM|nr:hypothetical protein [Marinomonas sp. 15G1-11]MCZ2721917.1 hypothetical protein [Marinomonas sp. 15G1-11]